MSRRPGQALSAKEAAGSRVFLQHLSKSMPSIGRQVHAPEQGPRQRVAEPELVVKGHCGTFALYSERHKAVQGKGLHRRTEDPDVGFGRKLVLTREGERHTCRERRGEQGGRVRVVHLDADIGHGPCKDVCVHTIATDEHALQRSVFCGPWACCMTWKYLFLHVDH